MLLPSLQMCSYHRGEARIAAAVDRVCQAHSHSFLFARSPLAVVHLLLPSLQMCSCHRCRHNNLKFRNGAKEAAARLSNVPDIEELLAVGRECTVCPFFLGKDLAKVGDGVWRDGA